MAGWQDFDVYQWMVVVTPSVDAAAWELIEARGAADKLRDDLQALTVVHQRERASLLEHQKAFSEAKDIIGKLQFEVRELRAEMDMVRAEKAAIETELAAKLVAPPPPGGGWSRRWRRLMGGA